MLSLYSDETFMKEAFKQAQYALEEGEIPIGAVVVCNNKILARAYNQTEKLNDVTAHAEMLAITSAANNLGNKYLHDCTLYVTVEPCPMCAGALNWSQIKRVVYATADEKRGYRKFGNLLHPKTELQTGIMQHECADLMSSFFRNKRI